MGAEHTRSADGTRIAFERIGSGAPVVAVVGGAFSTRDPGVPLDRPDEAGLALDAGAG